MQIQKDLFAPPEPRPSQHRKSKKMSNKTKQQIKHNFAALTKYIRDKCNSDYKEQADVLGISPYQISRWRTQGEPGQPDESHFEVLLNCFPPS